MKKTVQFWVIAILSTLAFAYYQRVTGPTYPITGSANLNGHEIKYKLERSHSSSSDYRLEIETGDPSVSGVLKYKKFNTKEEYTEVKMEGNEKLTADLPAQQALGKLDYQITLSRDNSSVQIPADKPLTIRFKDDVPTWLLIPHIFAMFFAMMLSNRTGLEFFNKEPQLEKLAIWTIIALFIGGFVLGFMMNGFAFGEVWGGWPFGHDVTDNKTQVAFIAWLIAFYFIKKKKNAKLAVLLAALVMIAIYIIPHSL